MNRIVLIGNSFDLAHRMKTSYQDFLNDYWATQIQLIKKTPLNQAFENDEFTITHSPAAFVSGEKYKDLLNTLANHKQKIIFKNTFLKIITEQYQIEKWVDVENEYYLLLKNCFSQSNKSKKYTINELNRDFEQIKKLLSTYLQKIESEFNKKKDTSFFKTRRSIGNKIYYPFKLKDFSETSLNQKAQIEYEYLKKDIEALKQEKISLEDLNKKTRDIIERIDLNQPIIGIRKMLLSETAINYFDLIPDQTLLLNFNYTFTETSYDNPREFSQFNDIKFTTCKTIHIHGTTDIYEKNRMIFGFGDELDDDYKSIEKLNNNEYLQNIKSINYLEKDNYKKLLEFVNNGNFQVYLFGHSCGISDRTLLNTVFEHENCASIKLFYHEKSSEVDNYSDIIMNISRNFNDKAKMRDRVVNKDYCEPLK